MKNILVSVAIAAVCAVGHLVYRKGHQMNKKKEAVKTLLKEGRSVSDIAYILGIDESEVLDLMAEDSEKKKLNLGDFKKEKTRRELIDKAKKCWAENKAEIVALSALVSGVITKIVTWAIKRSNLNKEADNKELYCYDRSLGHYWKLRRRLTNDEWVEIDKRKKGGERLADILDDLRVLY